MALAFSDIRTMERVNRLPDTIISLAKGVYVEWEIFKSIKSQTGASFYFIRKDIPATIIIKNDLKRISLQHGLEIIFKDKPIVWKFMHRNAILISRKK